MSDAPSVFDQPIDATIKSIKLKNVGGLCHWTAVFDSEDYKIKTSGILEDAEFIAKLFVRVSTSEIKLPDGAHGVGVQDE